MKSLNTLILFLITINLSFAQTDLYVSSGSYIFVDGNGFDDSVTNVAPLFVTNGIQLSANDSYIYLRNEAQLLQGNNVGNSGLGQLSTYQTGTVNRYSYNYWCSPVGNNSALVSNEAFKVNQIDEATNIITVPDPTGLISSIDVGFTTNANSSSSPLSISDYWLWTFVTSNAYNQWNYVGSNGNIAPGLGFTMKGVGTAATGNQLYDFRGKANNGTIINSVAAPITGDAQWTLVGNPYPSALDAFDFIHDVENITTITGDLYYWEQQQGQSSHNLDQYVGGYATYTISADGLTETFVNAVFSAYDGSGNSIPLPPPGGSGVKIAYRYIPIGQGFMVEGIADGTVRTTNAMREYHKQSAADSFFFRSASNTNQTDTSINEIQYNEFGLSIVPEDYKRFRINVVLDETNTRQLVQNFHDSATDGFDYGLEGKSPLGTTSDAYWILDGEPYVIQAFSFRENLRIPLVVKLDVQQSVRFSIFDIQRFDNSQQIYLHDIENDIYVDLRQQDYDINLTVGTYTNRFEITFTQDSTLSIVDDNIDTLRVFQDNKHNQLTILNPNRLDISNISLIDVSGKQIFSNPISGNESKYNYSTQTLSNGVYIAKIVLNDSKEITKKVIITN